MSLDGVTLCFKRGAKLDCKTQLCEKKHFMKPSTRVALLRWRERVREKYTKLLSKEEADFFKVAFSCILLCFHFYTNLWFR